MSIAIDTCRQRRNIYVRHDGQILYGSKADNERKRSIAKRKALDLQKLWEKRKKSSTFSVHVLKTSTEGISQHQFASTSKGHLNALSAHTKGVNTSASCTSEGACVSTVNAHTTGANASASVSASGVRINALNANITAVSTSASATADGLNVAVGNLSVTGAEAAISASASGAKIAVGNVDINGVSAGASAKINGTGVSAFNVCVGGPSASASVSVDGGLSFGNINVGLRPSLDIGFGLNFGIPFLSGSRLGSGGGDGGDSNNGGGNGDNNNRSGLAGLQQTLSERFPNRRYYLNPVDYPITRNTSGESIDPLLPDDGVLRTDNDNANVDNVVNRHNELVEDGNKFLGFKGYAPTSKTNEAYDPDWSGFYTSPSPDVARGYAVDNQGNPTHVSRVYVPKDAAKHYYTEIGLETTHGKGALHAVQKHSNGEYIFSGPQSSTDRDLFAPETVTSPAVKDRMFREETVKFESSAHTIDRSAPKHPFEEYHTRELECSKIVPDYIVGKKTAEDCARDGGRERLAHVFQGHPPYVSPNVPSKKKELNDDDRLLLEECKKLGMEIDPNDLDDYKKDMKSDAEYEKEEDAENRSRQRQNANANANATNNENSEKKKEEEEDDDDKPSEPCKDHPINIRCMKCLNRSSGARVRNIQGQIHGFKFS